MITVTDHEKREWSRMAQDAYSTGRNDIGHTYSAAASIPSGTRLDVARYDALQDRYRSWLVFGWIEADKPHVSMRGI